jgi:hypothetical protein
MHKTKPSILIALIVSSLVCCARPTAAVATPVDVSKLSLQDLINLGSTGVTIAGDRFYNFGFVDTSTAPPIPAANIEVNLITKGQPGIEFLAPWNAANDDVVSEVISYQIMATAAKSMIAGVNLFSDGAAPSPAPGTFASTALTVSNAAGSGTPVVAGNVLTTYADGGQTAANLAQSAMDFSPLNSLSITQSISDVSSNGGVATSSIVQDTFVPVPEPFEHNWLLPFAVILIITIVCRHRTPINHQGISPAVR